MMNFNQKMWFLLFLGSLYAIYLKDVSLTIAIYWLMWYFYDLDKNKYLGALNDD